MSKKRKSLRSTKPARISHRSGASSKHKHTTLWENVILAHLYSSKGSILLADIHQLLLEQGIKKRDIKITIDSALQSGLIVKDGKRSFTLGRKAMLYEGILVQHPKGFGFLSQARTVTRNPKLTRDPFISPSNMASAHHGDTVLVRVTRVRRDDRAESEVIKVLSQGPDTLTGVFALEKNGGKVYPDDPRYPFIIQVGESSTQQVCDGDAVIVRFERDSRARKVLSGVVTENLGPADEIDTQMRMVIETFNLPHQFDDNTLKETDDLIGPSGAYEGRDDLRSTNHVTIDGETAKDFDDAICVIKTRTGFRLYVSIADVSHYVRPGSALDKEAYTRGTSIYFPGRVIPMLPEKLSNDLCSLVPDKDRLTLSAILDFDRTGTLLKKHFRRSVICSKQRFTYSMVKKILIDKDPALRKKHKPFLTQLKWAQELATALKEKRRTRGSIDFNLAEPVFKLDEKGNVASIKKAERNFAHQLIEEFMLAANEAVAEFFSQKSIPAIYRVHESPDPLKTETFLDFTRSLGIELPPFENTPSWYAQALNQCKDSQFEYIVNNLLIRSMKQAHYAATNVGHFGLASSDYTHFTSPIRRYPDLMVHRQLIQCISQTKPDKNNQKNIQNLKDHGEFLSARERTAVLAERSMNDRLKISFMKEKVGELFDAIISGVNESALFIDITEHCISGSIAVDQLKDDFYIYDQKKHRLFGETTTRVYGIGDSIRVTLVNVDSFQKRLNFAPAS